ncbi:MAG: glycosyltransferase family 2 protein [Vulcanimicrobiaceae bacterium]
MVEAVSVVVPAFNEGDEFVVALERIAAYMDGLEVRYEIVVVDDGSTDSTAQSIARAQETLGSRLQVTTHDRNRGLSGALRTAFTAVKNPYVVVLDADLSYAPEIVGAMLEKLIGERAAIVVASPYTRGGRVSNVPFVRLAASRSANWLLALYTGRRVATLTGMVRAYRRTFLASIAGEEPVGEINSWILARALNRGEVVAEVPAHLCWPASRRAGANRVPLSKLMRGTLAVLATIGSMNEPTKASSSIVPIVPDSIQRRA